MISIFSGVNKHVAGRVENPQWHYVQRIANERIDFIRRWCFNAPLTVPPTHLIVRLLSTAYIPFSMAPEDVYDTVSQDVTNTISSFKLTSSDRTGAFHQGCFYGRDTYELYLVNEGAGYNVFDAIDDWMTRPAIKVIYNEKTDLNTIISVDLKMRGYSSEGRLAIFLIDLPLLAMQYKLFRDYFKKDPSGDASPQSFVARIVFPGLLKSHTDWCVLNRYLSKDPLAAESAKSIARYPFTLAKFQEPALNKMVNTSVNIARSQQADYRDILHQFPLLFCDSALELLDLPVVVNSVQVNWLIILSRLKVVYFLMQLKQATDFSGNQDYLNQLAIELRHAQFAHSIMPKLPKYIREEIYPYLRAILEKTDPNGLKLLD